MGIVTQFHFDCSLYHNNAKQTRGSFETFGAGRFFEAVGQSSRIFNNGKEGHIRASLAAEIGRPALLLSSPGKIRRTVGGVQMIKTVLYYKIIEENPHPKTVIAKPVTNSPAVAFQKASQRLPPAGGKELGSFFTATCAWGKIPLRLPVWNFCALRKNYARSRLQSLWQKNRRFFASCMYLFACNVDAAMR